METSFPEGESAALTLDLRAPKSFTIAFRRPSWAGDGFEVRVNDKTVAQRLRSGYVEITRTWMPGDEIRLMLPKTLRLDILTDNPPTRPEGRYGATSPELASRAKAGPAKAAVLWGPLVLAGDLGAAPRRGDDGDGDGVRAAAPDPVALVTDRPVTEWLKPVSGKPGVFQARGVARTISTQSPIDVEFSPFFSMHRRTYAAYWDVLTPAGLTARAQGTRGRARADARARRRHDRVGADRRSRGGEEIQSARRGNVRHPHRRPQRTTRHSMVLVRSAGQRPDHGHAGRDIQQRSAPRPQLRRAGRWPEGRVRIATAKQPVEVLRKGIRRSRPS